MVNKVLYNKLCAVFKDVQVEHEDVVPKVELLKEKRIFGDSIREWKIDKDIRGETYLINCPICGDSKHHCRISSLSYTCPQVNGRTLQEAPLLIHCFRRDCFRGNPENRKKVNDMIASGTGIVLECSAEQNIFGNSLIMEDHLHVNSDSTILKWSPDYHVITKDAPKEVLSYIEQRGISWRDIEELKIGWGKCWNYKNKSYIGDNNWLQFPIFDQAGFRGMQSRQLCEGCKMKYFFDTRTPKSMVLYNRQRASKYPIVAICEGIIDALHIGRCGMAFFGAKPTAPQIKIMQQDGVKMVLFIPDQKKHYTPEGKCDLDPPAIADSFIKQWNQNRLFEWGAYRIDVPKEDAGACTRTEIWTSVLRQLYKKVDDNLFDRIVKQIEEM